MMTCWWLRRSIHYMIEVRTTGKRRRESGVQDGRCDGHMYVAGVDLVRIDSIGQIVRVKCFLAPCMHTHHVN